MSLFTRLEWAYGAVLCKGSARAKQILGPRAHSHEVLRHGLARPRASAFACACMHQPMFLRGTAGTMGGGMSTAATAHGDAQPSEHGIFHGVQFYVASDALRNQGLCEAITQHGGTVYKPGSTPPPSAVCLEAEQADGSVNLASCPAGAHVYSAELIPDSIHAGQMLPLRDYRVTTDKPISASAMYVSHPRLL